MSDRGWGVLFAVFTLALACGNVWQFKRAAEREDIPMQVTYVDTDDDFSCTRRSPGVYVLKVGDAVDEQGEPERRF